MKSIFGCIVSLGYFMVLGMFVVGAMMGDCFEELGHHCPTDHERNMRILAILVVGFAVYGIIGFLIERAVRKRPNATDRNP